MHEETKRWKIAIQSGKRAMKYEQKVIESEGDTIMKECMRVLTSSNMMTEMGDRRRKFYEDKGWAANEVTRRIKEGETVWLEMTERGKDEERQRRTTEIRESIFTREISQIINHQDIPNYLKNTGTSRKIAYFLESPVGFTFYHFRPSRLLIFSYPAYHTKVSPLFLLLYQLAHCYYRVRRIGCLQFSRFYFESRQLTLYFPILFREGVYITLTQLYFGLISYIAKLHQNSSPNFIKILAS